MSNKTYYQRNRDAILNRAKDYKNDKGRLREQAREQDINTETYLKKKKTKRQNMEKKIYQIMPEKKKQRLKEYQKNYCETKKSQ